MVAEQQILHLPTFGGRPAQDDSHSARRHAHSNLAPRTSNLSNLMPTLLALLVGLLAGAHIATWGMYKDAIHEGFSFARYSRSILVGVVVGVVLEWMLALDLSRASQLVVLFGLVYVTERGIVETYKTFLREEDQSKYTIPMQFHIFGRVVRSRGARLVAGFLYVAGVTLALLGVRAIESAHLDVPRVVLVLLVGSIGGWISAVGGAWKDAPIEGFETFKFFRSPLIAAGYALLLARLTGDLLYITCGALGYTIATIETYKTFFFPSKPRGKFAGKPVHFPDMLRRRNHYVPLYVAIWVVMLAAMGLALLEPNADFASALLSE